MEHRRHTPSLAAEEVSALIASGANIQILDVRRFDEYATMNIPGSISVPGAELVLRAGRAAPDSETTIIVNCAGRTRSIIGTQSLINAGVTNKVRALRNGTIGWTLAKQNLEHGSSKRGEIGAIAGGEANARDVAYRAGVRHIGLAEMAALQAQADRTLYRFDVRSEEEYTAGHLAGFRHYPGGQLVQEIDMAAPVRGARIVLSDNLRVRADMTASWLAQMGWEVLVLEGGYDGKLEIGPPLVIPKPDPSHRYRRPYEGTDVKESAMQAYLDWEYGLVEQLRRDATPWILRDLMASDEFRVGWVERLVAPIARKSEGGSDTHHPAQSSRAHHARQLLRRVILADRHRADSRNLHVRQAAFLGPCIELRLHLGEIALRRHGLRDVEPGIAQAQHDVP